MVTYGLRKTDETEEKYGKKMEKIVHFNFHVDDALASHGIVVEAVSILQQTNKIQEDNGHLRIQKIISLTLKKKLHFIIGI